MNGIKKLVFTAVALTLTAVSVIHVFADTLFDGGRFLYKLTDWGTAVIYAKDGEDYTDIEVPAEINDRAVGVIGAFAFSGNEQLSHLSFEEAANGTVVSMYAFENCESLTEIKFSEAVYTIGIGAFEGCTSLTDMNLNATNLSVINNAAFSGCTSLCEVVIPDSATKIDKFAFSGCTSLESVEIGGHVNDIDDTSFNNCPNLVIHAPRDSYAYQYAVDKGISVVATDEVKLGDVNLDTVVNVRDVTLIQRYAAEFEDLSPLQIKAADIDGNGVPGMNDATELQRFIAEFDVSYPIGELV